METLDEMTSTILFSNMFNTLSSGCPTPTCVIQIQNDQSLWIDYQVETDVREGVSLINNDVIINAWKTDDSRETYLPVTKHYLRLKCGSGSYEVASESAEIRPCIAIAKTSIAAKTITADIHINLFDFITLNELSCGKMDPSKV